jgi:hypothetical protein
MNAPAPWPKSLDGTPGVAVIEQAIARQRLSHSLLLHGDDLGTLIGVAHAIADRLLNTPKSSAHFPVKDHPDYLALRPKGKMRLIPIGKVDSPEPGTMRAFLPKLYVTAAVAPAAGTTMPLPLMTASAAGATTTTTSSIAHRSARMRQTLRASRLTPLFCHRHRPVDRDRRLTGHGRSTNRPTTVTMLPSAW